jgi:hypothetical protein
MAALAWHEDPSSAVAEGQAYVYLITWDKQAGVRLTRWGTAPGSTLEAARQASRNSVSFSVSCPAGADPLEAQAGRVRLYAQQYEDGQSLPGLPAWQHFEGREH